MGIIQIVAPARLPAAQFEVGETLRKTYCVWR